MGTRGSVIIVQEGEVKGFYNHFDSYPEGLGKEVIKSLKQIDRDKGWLTFIKNCKKVELIEEGSKPSEEIQKRYEKFANTGVSSKSLTEWYVY